MIAFLKKYFWIPALMLIFGVFYYFFAKNKEQKNIDTYMEKNRINDKEKIISDIGARKELDIQKQKIDNKKSEEIENINSEYEQKNAELEQKKSAQIKDFEEMSVQELSALLAQNYKLKVGKK